MTAPLLSVAGLELHHGGVPALRGIDLSVQPGEAIALIGANGAGKSSFMQAVIGLQPIAAGHMAWRGEDMRGLPAHRRVRLGIGYCPEGRRVFPGMTVRDNLLVACAAGRKERMLRLDGMLALFPMLAANLHVSSWRLSGGQQQMLAIGRSMMNQPALLLLD